MGAETPPPCIVVFDSNAVDSLDNRRTRSLVSNAVDAGTLRVLYTHVTLDELEDVSDSARRRALIEAVQAVGELVPVAEWVLGASPLGSLRLGTGEATFEALRAGGATSDALNSVTARFEGCWLVTHDKQMRGRARTAGIRVCDMAELCRHLSG